MHFDQLSPNVTASRLAQKTRRENKGEILRSHVSLEPESPNRNWEQVCISKQKTEIQEYAVEYAGQLRKFRDIQHVETQACWNPKGYEVYRQKARRDEVKNVREYRNPWITPHIRPNSKRNTGIQWQEGTGKAFLSITHPSSPNKTTTSSSRWSSG